MAAKVTKDQTIYPRTLAPGVLVIGRYEPSRWTAETIGRELLRLTDSLHLQECEDLTSTSEVRSPETNIKIARKLTKMGWHSDREGADVWIVLWSNREQTEIRTPNRVVLKPEPYDVVLFHNKSVEHRGPKKMSRDRWFFRRFVRMPRWL
jgi:hypothetical protein